MKTRNLRRLLASLLCLCMVAGLLPAAGFAAELPAADPPDGNGFSDPVYQVEADTEPVLDTEPDDGTGPDANTDPFLTTNSASVSLLAANVSNNGPYQGADATTANHNTHIYVVESATNSAKYCPYSTYSGYTTSAPAGMRYDLSTNTLTLDNYNGAGYYIQTNMMGSDFTVELIGNNTLDGMALYGWQWGCGLTFTGSGTLTVNESRGRSYGLALYGEGAEPTLHVSRESTVTVYSATEGHPIFLEGSSSLSTSPITYDGQLSGGTPAAKRPNMVVNDIPTANGTTGNCVIYTKIGDTSGDYYGFTTAYSYNPNTNEFLNATYRLWKLTGDPAGGFTLAERVNDGNGEQVSYVSYIENEAPTEVAAAYTPVQEALANWSISADGDFLHPAQRVVFSPSGAVGGEQGISAVNAFFSTFQSGGTPSIRGGLPYSLFLYTAQPVTGAENATATVYYTPASGEPQSLTVNLTGTAGSYLLSGGGEALASDVTGTIDKVVFAMGEETREVSVNLPIVATARVSFTGAVSAKVAKYLEVYQGDTLLETVSLGWDPTPQATYVTWASADGSYTLQVTGTQYGRKVVYARGSISGLETTLALEDVTLTQVSPRVVDSNGEALELCYYLKWYASDEDDAKPIATGSIYCLLPGETLYVQAHPDGARLTRFASGKKTAVTDENPKPTIELVALPQYTVSGRVQLAGGTPLSGVTVTVSNTVSGNAVSVTKTIYNSGPFSLTTPVLEGAVLTVSRGDLESKTLPLTAGQDNTDLSITLSARRGVITLPSRNMFTSCELTTWDGESVAFTTSGDKKYIYLTEPGKAANQTLHMEMYDNHYYCETDVSLDSNSRANIRSTELPSFVELGSLAVALANPGRTDCYILLYDAGGALVKADRCQSWGDELAHYNIYLTPGRYTCLLLGDGPWQQVSYAQNSLAELKAALAEAGLSQYSLERSVEIQYKHSESINGTIPADTVSSPLNLEASGLTVTTEGEVVSVRMTVAPKDLESAPKDLSVSLYTNNLGTEASSYIQVINGSLYVNGKRPGDGNTYVYPNDSDHVTKFDGEYQIWIYDVDKYGGWPVTLQWQYRRGDPERVEALAYASLGIKNRAYFVGAATLYEPLITLYAPEAVAEASFYVYGSAPEKSNLTLFVDGVETAQLQVNEYGLYNVQLSLDNPIGPGEHTVSAKAVTEAGLTLTSNVMTVRYNASLPVLTKIQLTDYMHIPVTMWDSQNGADVNSSHFYYYMPNTAMRYFLTFSGDASGDALEEVTVYLPRADGVEKLPATYRDTGRWETDYYYCGDNPPTGAWVYYVPKEPAAQLTDGEYSALQEAVQAEAGDALSDTDQQREVNTALDSAGLNNVKWEDGKPTEGTLTFESGGRSYTFKITREEKTSGAGAAIANLPKTPTGAALETQMEQGFTFMLTGDNTQYTRMGTVDEEFTVETVSKYQAGNSTIWKHETMTMNRYEQVV